MTGANELPQEPLSAPVEALLAAFHARTPIRTGSLIVTVFGDAVVPRGGVLSLASLLRITRAFRIGDGLVRTALSRLVGDGWFERMKAGRNTFYRLTATGRATFADATDKIYQATGRAWAGRFDAVLHDGDDRDGFRAVWAAAGYGQLSGDLMIAPADAPPMPDGAAALHLELVPRDAATARRLAHRGWPLGDVERRYEAFIGLYAHVAEWLRGALAVPEADALVIRLSLVHDFRRIVLADPQLPAALLPQDWHGTRARHLCGDIYRAVVAGAEAWLDRAGESKAGALPPPDAAFADRFSR